jgi:hypothetical protein
MSTFERDVPLEDPAYLGAVREDAAMQSGWLTFAGLAVELVGLANATYGCIGLFRSAYFTGTAVFGTLAFWSIVWIAVGVLQVAAGIGIFSGRAWARWFGIVMMLVSAAANLMSIGEALWFSIFIVAADVFILYALIIRWPRPEPPTASAA